MNKCINKQTLPKARLTHRRFIQQLNLGLLINLPDIYMVPSYLSPQVNLIYPSIPLTFDEDVFGSIEDGLLFKWNVGFGWEF